MDHTLIDIKTAQKNAIKDFYNLYRFEDKTDLDSFSKRWDELTDYHYSFYIKREISYDEQRIRRITDLFQSYG